MLDVLIQTYRQQGAYLSPAATDEDLKNLKDIPTDYAAFLKQSNGMMYNGIILFGTKPMQTAGDMQDDFPAMHTDQNGRFIIGQTTDGARVTVDNSGAYTFIDGGSDDVLENFSSLRALLEFYLHG